MNSVFSQEKQKRGVRFRFCVCVDERALAKRVLDTFLLTVV